jgi:hypothetical protein
MVKMKVMLVIGFIFFYRMAAAQIEYGHLSFKNYSGILYGLNFTDGFPLSKTDAIIAEVNLDNSYTGSDSSNITLTSPHVGYMHIFSKTGAGFYVQPTVGYNLESSSLEQHLSGPSVSMAVGNISEPSLFRYNIGIQYEHAFVIKGISQNIFLISVKYTLWGNQKRRTVS